MIGARFCAGAVLLGLVLAGCGSQATGGSALVPATTITEPPSTSGLGGNGPTLVSAIDGAGRVELWRVQTSEGLDAVPDIATDGSVVVGFNGGCGATGRRPIVAWDAATGAELWHTTDRVPMSGQGQDLLHVGEGVCGG